MQLKTRIRTSARDAVLRVWYGSLPGDEGYPTTVFRDDAGNGIVRETLASGRPCLVTRLGATELACVNHYTRWRLNRAVKIPYPKVLRRTVHFFSGVFSTDDDSLDRFSELTLDSVSKADVLGVWFYRNEHRIIASHCPDARLIDGESLTGIHYSQPWSSELADKVVLVVHPFTRSIESQYRDRRTLLFSDPDVLPEFELKTLPAVQSIAGARCEHDTWFDALSYMSDQIENIDFDIAIIGAGAYGLPLGAAVKQLGRQAVHLGGATQLLFGIKGKRWEEEFADTVAPLFNEHWVRPLPEETPRESDRVEGGCYW